MREAVVTAIGDHYGFYGRILPMDTELRALGSDALDKLEVLMTMEELFGVYFDATDRSGVTTVGDIVDLVERSLSQDYSRNAPDQVQSRAQESRTKT